MKSSITVDKLIRRAQELGYKSIALTDEHVLHGAVSFYQACMDAGIKPIIGMTVLINNDNELPEECILLAKNNRGYGNLIRLSSHIQLSETNWIRSCDINSYLTDLIIILPVAKSKISHYFSENNLNEASTYVNNWKSVVNNCSFYLGVEPTDLAFSSWLRQLCTTSDISATAIGDVRFLNKSDKLAFDCLQAMREGNKWSPNMAGKSEGASYLWSKEEVEKAYGTGWPQLLEEAGHIAECCQLTIDLNQRRLPSFPVPDGKSADVYLKELCYDMFPAKYRDRADVKERLEYELRIIKSMHFSDYFLIVWDFIQYAKDQGIMVGPGRGSAAGSFVAYLLGITDVDPIHYQLLFERFLNPERISMPDIDIDFSDQRRDEVITYVKNKYGKDHVAQIITFGTFGVRSIIRELLKTMEIDSQDAAFVLKEIADNERKSVAESVNASQELTNYVKQSPPLQILFKIAARLEGLPRNVSTHAAGVVISEQPLVDHVPLIASQSEVYLTQFAMKELEAMGLLKMDFLGLRNLTLIEKILASISANENIEINLNHIPFDDEKTFALLQKGKTNGVFQLESQGMQRVLIELIPTNFEDIVAVNALYRPGPMEYIPVYIRRKHNKEQIIYPHKNLMPILKSTYGVLVYQEQIMQIANKVAGFNLGQADILRRAVSKKQEEAMKQQEKSFIQGCLEKGYSKQVAEEIFTWIVRFSNYGFNRSHAVGYSKISYYLAYLKAHYPAYFLAELLSSITGQQDKTREYIREAKEFGISVLPPSINNSFGKFTTEEQNIRMGLLTIKGVGYQAIKEIIQARKEGPFKHLFDFCLRVSLKVVNRPVIESLILAGAFDETNHNRASLLATIDQAIEQGELFREFEDQPSFFLEELDVTYIETEPFSKMKQLSMEKELIGLYMSNHPLTEHRSTLRENGYINLLDIRKHIGKNNLSSAAVIQTIKSIRTKRGDSMAFLTIADENDEMDAVLFPDLYRQVHRIIHEELLVFIKGKVEERNGRTQLLISDIRPFDKNELNHNESKRLFIKVTEDQEKIALNQMKHISDQFPGTVPIIIFHEKKRTTYKLSSDYFVQPNQSCMQAFFHAFGRDNVAIQNSS